MTFRSYIVLQGSSWSWSYGSQIYNYLCKQCLSPLTLWVRILLMARCTRYNIMWKILSATCGMSVFSAVSSTYKTDPHVKAEILLKVVLNTITLYCYVPHHLTFIFILFYINQMLTHFIINRYFFVTFFSEFFFHQNISFVNLKKKEFEPIKSISYFWLSIINIYLAMKKEPIKNFITRRHFYLIYIYTVQSCPFFYP